MPKVYLKLSDGASSYNDTMSQISMAHKEIKMIDDWEAPKYKYAKRALVDGHLREATEKEYEKWKADESGFVQEAKKKKGSKKNDMTTENTPTTELEEPKDEDEDDEDLDEDLQTDGEKREFLKESPFVDATQKLTLSKLKGKELDKVYQQVKAKK